MKNKFLLGAATAAHQVEGNNINSDCWAAEHMSHSAFDEPSDEACDSFNRYEEDIRLLSSAGLNAYRFSVEWARIEPRQGVFDEQAMAHYKDVCECCVKYGVEPVVTLHHFSSPLWLVRLGGWENPATIEYFTRYCTYVVKNLRQYLSYVCTINEANIGLQIASLARNMSDTLQLGMDLQLFKQNAQIAAQENERVFGTTAPQMFLTPRSAEGDKIVTLAHVAAKKAIKGIAPELKVGLTLSLHDIQSDDQHGQVASDSWEEEFLHYLPYINDDDFIGVQNYTRTVFGNNERQYPVSQCGYEVYPQALEHVVRRVYNESKLPVLITENGVATDDDEIRCKFIDEATDGVVQCIADGVPVSGYFYWSLLDNFEWQKGYLIKFGLVAVDRTTQQRMPKPSLYRLEKTKLAKLTLRF